MDAETLSSFADLLRQQDGVDLIAMLDAAQSRLRELSDLVQALSAEVTRRGLH